MGDVLRAFTEVNHKLCESCPHNDSCTSVCIAIECLVQICLESKIIKRLEMIDNASDLLDLNNSFKAKE